MGKFKRKKNIVAMQEEPKSSLPISVLENEQATILNDNIRQYIGNPSTGVFTNNDEVLKYQTYLNYYGYDLYDELEKDPHISAVYQTRKLAVAGLEWNIVPFDETPRSKELAEFVKDALYSMDNLEQDLIGLLDAIGKGFAVGEVLWGQSAYGGTQNKIVPKKIMNRPQRRFQFNATSRELQLKTLGNSFFGISTYPYKFIIHRNSQKYENPFGEAVDEKIYWMWYFKKQAIKFWMQHSESTAAPIPFVKHPAKTTDETKREALEIARKIRNGSYGRIPDNFEIVFAEAQNIATTGTGYDMLIRFMNDEITKAILGQVITTEGSSSGGIGSHGSAVVANNVRLDILEYDAKSLSSSLNATLVKWIVDLNYANVTEYPFFEFKSSKVENLKEQAEIINILKNSGYIIEPNFIQEKFGMPLIKGQSSMNNEPTTNNKKQ